MGPSFPPASMRGMEVMVVEDRGRPRIEPLSRSSSRRRVLRLSRSSSFNCDRASARSWIGKPGRGTDRSTRGSGVDG